MSKNEDDIIVVVGSKNSSACQIGNVEIFEESDEGNLDSDMLRLKSQQNASDRAANDGRITEQEDTADNMSAMHKGVLVAAAALLVIGAIYICMYWFA